MESTVDDFLNEINEIIPLEKARPKKGHSEWKECFDSNSGFPYYWNTTTNEVTWEKPAKFVSNSSVNGPVPNISEIKNKVKIYRISAEPNSNKSFTKTENKKAPVRKRARSDSDDEKITLITSYGSSSESENEDQSAPKASSKESESENQDDDVLSCVLKRAEELKNLGNIDSKSTSKQADVEVKTVKPISGFSLVAGYDSNSEDENADDDIKTNQSKLTPQTQSHSTLFPIMKTPDLNDFKVEETSPKEEANLESSFDMKNFKRKRRLGVTFVPNKNEVNPLPSTDTERKGLGFKEDKDEKPVSNQSKSLYSNFTKGGVEFVKPVTTEENESENSDEVDEQKIKEVYEILHEKLSFLCEGNKDVMPVQIILIQIETLYGALKAESLKPSYLQEWLLGTSEDLIKLEKEAAPEGWSLQWDRLEKRYFYQNQENGRTQWEFPQTEFERQEEAMDICTTPPPPDVSEKEIEQKSPPSGQIPSPPPAPIISKIEPEATPETKAPSVLPCQPLPPGVDITETTFHESSDIDSAFNTFYSELAEIEKTSKPCSPTNAIEQTVAPENVDDTMEPVKKKKKKMKLGQGLSLKKKDVSKLVEKWKSVQNNY